MDSPIRHRTQPSRISLSARLSRFCLLASLAFSILALSHASALAKKPLCFHSELPPLSQLLLKPPADNSAETKAELAELQALEASRSAQQAEHAEGDHKRTIKRFLGEMGVKVDKDQLGDVDQFFECVHGSVEEAVEQAKDGFRRTRPYKLPDNGLHPLKKAKPDDSFSYPSGHAAYGAAVGLILIEMVPELRDKIYARIEDFGFSRMVSGVHFRSDVYAGEIAGAAVAASLHRDKDFHAGLETTKAELRKALGY